MGTARLMRARALLWAALAAVLLTGCGNDGTSDDATGADDSGDDVQTIEVTITDGAVSPEFDTYEVEHGGEVLIEVTSDVADELHLHGYDLELEVEPGVPGALEFTADLEGRFELETHETGLQLLQLEVR